jgi:hypothetical protein
MANRGSFKSAESLIESDAAFLQRVNPDNQYGPDYLAGRQAAIKLYGVGWIAVSNVGSPVFELKRYNARDEKMERLARVIGSAEIGGSWIAVVDTNDGEVTWKPNEKVGYEHPFVAIQIAETVCGVTIEKPEA